MKEEYTRENYPSFGKKYNDEKAIISLTSWRARINTVSKTLFSLLKQCPGFHIVLVLSEEEFPKMCEELPENLMLFVENKMIELLWVYKNYKSFKKVLFTMDKYRDVPVISADDDMIYVYNFAEKLFRNFISKPNKIYSANTSRYKNTTIAAGGGGVLYPPYCFGENGIKMLSNSVLSTNHDDMYFALMAQLLNIDIVTVKTKDRNSQYIGMSCSKSGLGYKHLYNDKIIYKLFNELHGKIK